MGMFTPKLRGTELVRLTRIRGLSTRILATGRFKDVSATDGAGITEHFSSRGAAFGDYDNDGDMDVVVLNLNNPPSLLRNEGAISRTGSRLN